MRSYDQWCGLASTLDIVGDRWTLLIVRELLYLGPRRFTDLQNGLPGIAPNLLTQRLRDLEHHRVVERATTPAPAPATVYRLTARGEELREAVGALMRWGRSELPAPPRRGLRPELPVMALAAAVPGRVDEAHVGRWRFEVGSTRVDLIAEPGGARVEPVTGDPGDAVPVDAVIRTDLRTFADLVAGRRTAGEAAAAGTLVVEGDGDALLRLVALLEVDPVLPVPDGDRASTG